MRISSQIGNQENEDEEYDPWELWERALNDELRRRSEEAVQHYLGTFGDAIESRVKRCLEDAERLYKFQFYGSALTTAVTSIELIIRFLLIRPLVSGAFLSREWEELLAEKIGSGRTDDDRKILPKLLLRWGIDVRNIALPEGELLWPSLTNLTSGLLAKRNRVVHQGEEASQSEAIRAIHCARIILNDIVYQLASKFGFTRETTSCWSIIKRTYPNGDIREKWFSPQDPISRKPHKSEASEIDVIVAIGIDVREAGSRRR
jgi:hypothetical protein